MKIIVLSVARTEHHVINKGTYNTDEYKCMQGNLIVNHSTNSIIFNFYNNFKLIKKEDIITFYNMRDELERIYIEAQIKRSDKNIYDGQVVDYKLLDLTEFMSKYDNQN